MQRRPCRIGEEVLESRGERREVRGLGYRRVHTGVRSCQHGEEQTVGEAMLGALLLYFLGEREVLLCLPRLHPVLIYRDCGHR